MRLVPAISTTLIKMTMKRIKQTILTMLVGLTALTTYAQSIKEYFIPEIKFNKASFYSPDKKGERSSSSRTIWYVNINDGNYDVWDVQSLNKNPGIIQVSTIHFTTKEVIWTKSAYTDAMGTTNQKQTFSIPKTILKMPPTGQTITWTTTELSGDKKKCIASWTTVAIEGINKKAIKVVSVYEDLGKTNSYYVNDIGLWKVEISSKSGTIISDKFDGLSYDSTLK
jgi:hypothetical protein